jgi:peptidoglycan/xylan/chitin deacetylase (PgdA/CDA1 family)
VTAYLVITVDVEEEGLWSGAYAAHPDPPRSLPRLNALAASLAEVGARISCLVTYSATLVRGAEKMLRELVQAGHEVGSHLHPWSTPPFEAAPARTNAESLDLDLLQRKMERLDAAVARACGSKPVSFRGGRFHCGSKTLTVLRRLDYRVDSSVVPWYCRHGGPDYWGVAETPYLIDGEAGATVGAARILEVPLSIRWQRLKSLRPLALQAPVGLRPQLWRLLNATGVIARLRPTFVSLAAMQRFARKALAARHPVLNVMFHSSELLPGATPYHRTPSEVEMFENKIVAFSRWALTAGRCRAGRLADLAATALPAGEDRP